MIVPVYTGVWWLLVCSRVKSGLSTLTCHQLFTACTFTRDMDTFEIIKNISRCSEVTTIIDTYRTEKVIRELIGKYLKLVKRKDINLDDSIPVSIPHN
jgi:hypothetical protein